MIKKDIKSKIAEYFFINPTAELRVRQIERTIKVPLPSAIRYTQELEKEGLLKSAIIADIKLYSADRSSKRFLLAKRLFNIEQLFSSGLIEFLIEKYSNPSIVLFGSYSRGEDVEESDIDLFIQTPSKTVLNLTRFEKVFKRKIQIFQYKNINYANNKDLANNIINGITLNGMIEVFK